ncbi:MAG: ORF6N domain-containing protein, partial [Bacillota bacterium]
MNNLTPIEHKDQRILITEQLAQAYETDVNNIHANFNRNKDKFIEGKHYFLLQGKELKEFKSYLTISQLPINKFAPQLLLWTDRGASRHCKILDTDKAWEQFDHLEESYFQAKQPLRLTPNELILSLAQANVVFEKRLDTIEAS